jgi:hypothetical protein
MKIIGHMQQMENIEEPVDFLDKVNIRLDKRFSLRGLFRRLFIPLRIKIPLELAAAAVVIAVMVYLGGVKEPEQLYQITVTENDIRMPEDEDIDGTFGGARTSPEKSHASKDKLHEMGGDTQKSDKSGEDLEKTETRGDRLISGAIKSQKIEVEETVVGVSDMREAAAKKGPKREISIEETIRSLGGKVVETEYLEGTNTPARMILEIPVGKFESLMQELIRMGKIQAPPTEIKKQATDLIRVELIFQRPEPQK